MLTAELGGKQAPSVGSVGWQKAGEADRQSAAAGEERDAETAATKVSRVSSPSSQDWEQEGEEEAERLTWLSTINFVELPVSKTFLLSS